MLRLALQYVSQMHAPFLQAPSPAYRVCTNAIAHGLLSLDRMHSATGSGDAGAAEHDQQQPDTIFALSSGAGRAAIAVIRMSGPSSGR